MKYKNTALQCISCTCTYLMIFTIIVLQLCTTIVLRIIVVLGSVFVGVKDITFEPSSPFWHMAELHSVLQSHSFSKPVLFIYSDGGPDHRLTYINVQLSLICLFLKFNLDYLCAGRTAPHHSWRNPVERIMSMSILNLGLQCVGLARSEMSAEFEAVVQKCSGLAELRQQVVSYKDELNDSLSPVKARLHILFCRLQLHNKNFEIYHSAIDDEMSEFWSTLLTLDSTLMEGGTYRKDNIGQHAKVVEFISHCCQCSHYTFDILKCGLSTCKRYNTPARDTSHCNGRARGRGHYKCDVSRAGVLSTYLCNNEWAYQRCTPIAHA